MSEKLEKLITDIWENEDKDFYEEDEDYDPKEVFLIKPMYS